MSRFEVLKEGHPKLRKSANLSSFLSWSWTWFRSGKVSDVSGRPSGLRSSILGLINDHGASHCVAHGVSDSNMVGHSKSSL